MNNLITKIMIRARNRLILSRVQHDPVFVLQMGRVGSTSITAAVREAYKSLPLNVPVYHSHYLANYNLIFERASIDLHDPSGVQRDMEHTDKKNRNILHNYLNNNQPIKIISLVRDPVARNVSTFFYAFPKFVLNWREKEDRKLLAASELHKIFETKQNYIQTALNWFEEQIGTDLDIDIYAVPFNKKKGYQIYNYEKIQLLILRMEDLYHTGENALKRFLGTPHLRMVKVNTGAEREAYELYRRFLTHPVSRLYLEKTYSSRLARHFYTDEEIEGFISKWSNPRSA